MGSGGQGRLGFEQVAEAHGTIVNPPAVLVHTRPDPTLTAALVEFAEFALGGRQNVGPNPAITAPAPNDFFTLEAGALAQRKGLGLVLPIEIPTNYLDEGVAYWSPSAAPGQHRCSVTRVSPPRPARAWSPGFAHGLPAPRLLPVHVLKHEPDRPQLQLPRQHDVGSLPHDPG